MNALAFPLHQDERVVSTIETIDKAFASRYGRGPFKQELRECVAKLHELCRVFEDSGAAEIEERLYFCVFDALAFLTSALRFPGVNAQELRRAQAALAAIGEVSIPY